ncbi:MAG: glutaredoxin family protein [Nodosilinea sp.]
MVQLFACYVPRSTAWPRWLKGSGALAVAALLMAGCSPRQPQAGVDSSYEAQLARQLAASGSVMYGAYWCPHCADQKAMFGEAVDLLPYVECAVDGDNAQPQLCAEKGIRGYPTWEINGQLYPGVQPLDELATLLGQPLAQ